MTTKASPELLQNVIERGNHNLKLVLPQDVLSDESTPSKTNGRQPEPSGARDGIPDKHPGEPPWKQGALTAEELQAKKFPATSFLIEDIIPAEGVTLLCSKPKFGKSWFVYDLCIGITMNWFILGEIKPAQGNALYLALEDSERRLQRRMAKLMPSSTAWPSKLTLKTEWRRLHEGGLDDIRAWHTHTKNNGGKPILVIIDVLAKVRKPAGNRQLYEADYEALTGLTVWRPN